MRHIYPYSQIKHFKIKTLQFTYFGSICPEQEEVFCQNSCLEIFKNFLGKLKKMESIFKKFQVFNLQIFEIHSIDFDFYTNQGISPKQLLVDAFDTSVTLDCHFLLQEQKQYSYII